MHSNLSWTDLKTTWIISPSIPALLMKLSLTLDDSTDFWTVILVVFFLFPVRVFLLDFEPLFSCTYSSFSTCKMKEGPPPLFSCLKSMASILSLTTKDGKLSFVIESRARVFETSLSLLATTASFLYSPLLLSVNSMECM